MTTNYSRPLQSPAELDVPTPSTHAETSQSIPPFTPRRPRPSIFAFLKKNKTRTESSQDECRPPSHFQYQHDSYAAHVRLEKTAQTLEQQKQHEIAKAKAKAYKREKQMRTAEEKARKHIIGGVAWGFDPSAGMRKSKEGNDSERFFVSGRTSERPEGDEREIDHLWKLTGRRWTTEGKWGIEHGGPGQEGKFAHGMLKGKGRGRRLQV